MSFKDFVEIQKELIIIKDYIKSNIKIFNGKFDEIDKQIDELEKEMETITNRLSLP